jgi:Fe-S-cluster containining protein
MKRIYNIVNINLTAIQNDAEIADVPCDGCTKCCETLAPYLTSDEISSGKYPLSITSPTPDDKISEPKCGPIITLYKNPVTLGCGMFKDGICTIYDIRPIACRQFDCRKGHHHSLVKFAEEKFGKTNT